MDNVGLIVVQDPATNAHRKLITQLATRYRLPVIRALRAAAVEGTVHWRDRCVDRDIAVEPFDAGRRRSASPADGQIDVFKHDLHPHLED
jgi:hypothetical protein